MVHICFQCKDFAKAGAEECLTPSDVVAAADIIFSCVADPKAAKEVNLSEKSHYPKSLFM